VPATKAATPFLPHRLGLALALVELPENRSQELLPSSIAKAQILDNRLADIDVIAFANLLATLVTGVHMQDLPAAGQLDGTGEFAKLKLCHLVSPMVG